MPSLPHAASIVTATLSGAAAAYFLMPQSVSLAIELTSMAASAFAAGFGAKIGDAVYHNDSLRTSVAAQRFSQLSDAGAYDALSSVFCTRTDDEDETPRVRSRPERKWLGTAAGAFMGIAVAYIGTWHWAAPQAQPPGQEAGEPVRGGTPAPPPSGALFIPRHG